jgi:hypothetical protein
MLAALIDPDSHGMHHYLPLAKIFGHLGQGAYEQINEG